MHTIITAATNDVTIGNGQAIGAFTTDVTTGDKKLITSFQQYDSSKSNTYNYLVSNHLKINGKLTINGSGQMCLNGQIKASGRDAYSGLQAGEVEVNGDGKVTNMLLGSADIGTLTINSGIVKIHTDGTPSGNSLDGIWKPSFGTDCKFAKFSQSIVVNSGKLQIGYASRAGSGAKHYATWFAKNLEVEQHDGTMSVAAQAYVEDGVSFTQTGGSFDTPTTVNGQLGFTVSKGATVSLNQTNPDYASTDPSTDPSNPVFTIRRLALSSSSAKALSFNITQTADNGTINLTSGAPVSGSGGFATTATSALVQDSMKGVINFSGDFSGAVYDISQSRGSINIKDGATFVSDSSSIAGTLNVASNAKFTASQLALLSGSKLQNSGSLIVGSGATATIGSLSVSSDGTLNLVLDGTNAALVTSADTVTGWAMAAGSSLGIGFTSEYLGSLTANVANGVKTYDFTQGVLVAQDKNDSVTLADLQYGTIQGMSSNWTWSTDTKLEENTTGDISLTGKLSFNPYVTVNTDNDHITYTDDAVGGEVGIVINSSVELAGNNSHTLGTKIDGGDTGITVTLGHANALGTGDVTTTGTTTLATANKVTAVLPGTISNSGALTLDGSFSATGWTGTKVDEAYVGGNVAGNGFARDEYMEYAVVEKKDNAASLTVLEGTTIEVNGEDYLVNADGKTYILPDYATYYILTSDADESAVAIRNAGTTRTTVDMTDGKLTVDADMEVNATGGTIAVESGKKVSGSIENATVSGTTGDAISGIVTATLESANTLTGNLTLGESDVLSGATVTTTGATSLSTDVASGKAVELGEVIKNTGDLTLSGSYDVRKLDAEAVTAGFVAANGDVTPDGNGFKRDDGCTVLVVNNENGGSLKEGDTLEMTIGTRNDGVLDEATGVVTFGAGVDYSTYRMVEDVEESALAIIDASVDASGPQVEKVTMTAGTLKVDASITVDAEDGSTLKMTGNDVKLTGEIDGASTSVQVTGSGIIEGDNSYSGGTVIDGGKLAVASEKALGTGDVVLKNHGTLDLSGKAVSNYINVEGCTLAGAGAYSGIMDVSGNLQLQDATTAAKVVMLGGGTISGAPLTTTALDVNTDGNATIGGDLTINDNGTITLKNGSLLEVGGSLTLGNGTKLVLKGDYAVGTSLLSSTGTLTMGDVSLVYGDSTVELEKQGNSLVLVSKFKQNKATATTLSNWGIATASRAVVNAVRGQRSNTGCIADGKGTAWVASLGSKHEINGSDINISGAAVGADMQVGRNSRIGIALGYAEGEVQPSGLRQVDQEGSYIAAYGEHGLKKLSATSCLSMDWVAAYGTTDSEVGGLKWEQDSLQLNSRVNWNKKVNDKLSMSVFGGLEYFANNSDTVDGVKTGSIQNLRGEIGVGARYVAWGTPAVTDGKSGLVLAQGCEKLVLNGEVRYMNDMVRSNPVIRMNGLSGMGENPGRQGIGIEAGATYRIGERWSASANYGFNTMEDSKEHRLNVGAAYTF